MTGRVKDRDMNNIIANDVGGDVDALTGLRAPTHVRLPFSPSLPFDVINTLFVEHSTAAQIGTGLSTPSLPRTPTQMSEPSSAVRRRSDRRFTRLATRCAAFPLLSQPMLTIVRFLFSFRRAQYTSGKQGGTRFHWGKENVRCLASSLCLSQSG
jgi:hypothetical protein